MKTKEEYKAMLEITIKQVETAHPNWRLIQDKDNFASMFSGCMPRDLTYEDIAILCFMFHHQA